MNVEDLVSAYGHKKINLVDTTYILRNKYSKSGVWSASLRKVLKREESTFSRSIGVCRKTRGNRTSVQWVCAYLSGKKRCSGP